MQANPAQLPLVHVPRERALCFTGHRPEKLPQGEALTHLLNMLHLCIEVAVKKGYTHFYTGLADGIDYYAAEHLFRLRETDPAIVVIGVQPCTDYREFFRVRGYSMPRLEYMLANADALVTLPGSYRNSGIFGARNRYMVDHSAAILAVCSKGRSGSMQTYHYAEKQQLARCRICLEQPRQPVGWEVERYGF